MAVSARLRSISEHLWLVTTRHGTFGSLLGLRLQRDGGPLRFQRLDASTSEVSVPLPEWAARRDGTLCLGAALALADEVSTYAGTALWDQRKRPGVTITISGQLVGRAQVAPGEELTIVTRPLKSGKSLAHVEMAKAVKAHLEASGEFEVKEFVLATTKNSYVLRKNKSYLDGRDRERLITIAAKEQGLDWLRAVDGSRANSGTEFVDDHFIPTGDWRTLKVEGSDTACRYGRKPGKCVVILRTKETADDVKRKRPGAIIVPGLGGALGDLSSTKVRNARDPAVVARFCGPAVAKAMASMTRHGSAP